MKRAIAAAINSPNRKRKTTSDAMSTGVSTRKAVNWRSLCLCGLVAIVGVETGSFPFHARIVGRKHCLPLGQTRPKLTRLHFLPELRANCKNIAERAKGAFSPSIVDRASHRSNPGAGRRSSSVQEGRQNGNVF